MKVIREEVEFLEKKKKELQATTLDEEQHDTEKTPQKSLPLEERSKNHIPLETDQTRSQTTETKPLVQLVGPPRLLKRFPYPELHAEDWTSCHMLPVTPVKNPLELVDREGFTPLTRAITQQNIGLAETLLQAEANLDTEDSLGRTPIFIAAENHNLPLIQLLLKYKADINTVDSEGMTAIHRAIQKHDALALRLLKEAGASLNETSADGWTPMTWTVEQKAKDMIIVLHELGADIQGIDTRGWMPLTWALHKKDQDITQLVQQLGAQINGVDSQDGWTQLSLAIRLKNEPMVRELVTEIGVDIDVIDRTGCSPLAAAYLLNLPAIARVLEELHADTKLAEQLHLIHLTSFMTGLYGKIPFIDPKGQHHEIELEGGMHQSTIPLFSERVCTLLDSDVIPLHDINPFIRSQIKKAAQEAAQIITNKDQVPNASLVTKIQRGETVDIPSGWPLHSISILFGDNKVFICNRGIDAEEHAIMAYQCDASEITEEFIDALRQRKADTGNDFYHFFKTSPAVGPILSEECFDLQFQKIGNCAWANCKAAFLVLVYLELKKASVGIPTSKIKEISFRCYKLWSTQVRFEAIVQ